MLVSINKPASQEEAAIRAEQVQSLYANNSTAVAGNALIALILAGIQWDVVAAPSIIGWLILMMFALAVRTLLFVAHRRAAPGDDSIWLQRFRISVAAIGVVWGLASLLIFPAHNLPHQVFLTFALGGMTAAAITTLSIDRVSILAFTLPALVAVIVRLFIEGTVIQTAMGVMTALFLLLTDMISQRTYRTLCENVILRISVARREQEFSSLVESAPDGIIRYDLGCRAVYVNHVLEEMVDVVSGSLIGKTPMESKFVGLIGVENYQTKLQQVIYTGESQDVEIMVSSSSGDQRAHHICFVAERGSDGEIIGALAFGRDITERKAMENELKASEAKFRSIIEFSPVPMALLDEEQSSLTYLNPAFIKTFGYNLDDIPTLANWWPKAYPDPDYRHWILVSWQMAMEKAKQENTNIPPLEVVIYCKNSNVKNIIISVAEIHNTPGLHLVMLYDITERKQIEAKLNAIFNASVEGIITYDMSGIIVSVNTAVETIFGYKPEELIGCSINKIMPSSPRAMNDRKLHHAVKSGGHIQEIEGIHKNGSVVPLDLSIAEYSIDDAHFYTTIVRDVSLRKYREQQDKKHLDELAHVTRLGLMGEMASGIAHEVNQPLCAISNYTKVSLNLINTEDPDLVKLTDILYKTQQQALRAGRIIHRMRDFVKAHSKHRSTADLNALIHDAADLCISELKHNDIKLTFNLENNLPPVYVDHIQIEQVIINLVRNSVDALQDLPAKQQRYLSIHSRLILNNDIQVRVKDNGLGIDEVQQQKILMPFYTTKTDGMGMGLSISRSIIEAHEGTLHFRSKPGKGAVFYFTLPAQIEVVR